MIPVGIDSGRRMFDETLLGGKVCVIPTQCFEDPRGVLTAIEFTRFGFRAVRAFVVTAPPGAERGGHGHVEGRQILLQISGRIELELVWQDLRERVTLDTRRRAVLIEPQVWSKQIYEGENPSMIVFCDTPYDPGDYLMTKS
jgi:dTDP-4-dehydrorhamnose 3,5-epimerase-like enzyme